MRSGAASAIQRTPKYEPRAGGQPGRARMIAMRTILVVDDDPHIREVIAFALEQAGMRVESAADGNAALNAVERHRPDLVILDILMPEMDGLEVCRRLRKVADTPILFLSSKSDEIDRVIGLEIGGDDYVTKPFSPRELVARVGAILRRAGRAGETGEQAAEQVLSRGRLSLDLEGRTASWDGAPVQLTAREFNLLATLMARPNRVFDRDELMDHACGADVVVNRRTMDSHVRGVRGRFAELGAGEVIETVHGVGYKLGPCE